MKSWRQHIVGTAACVFILCGTVFFGTNQLSFAAPSTLEAPEKSCACGPRWWPVEHVRTIDGNTFVLDIDLGWRMMLDDERIRLETLDTPELYRGTDKARGKEAKRFADEWLKANAPLVFISAGDERDKRGRLLGDVCRADYGQCIASELRFANLEKL